MVKYLAESEKPLSRDLWAEAFPEDSRSFDDYYYREKTKDNRILADLEDGCVQAMVQLNPYLVQAGSRRWRVDYLVGVATRKDKRHQGYMRRLLERMMSDLREEEMPFCFLMPADEAIYRPFGFTYIFRQPQWELVGEKELTRRPLLGPDAGCRCSRWAENKGGRGADACGCVDTAGMTAAAWRGSAGGRRYLGWLADWMNRWLEQRYEVFAVRDTGYLLRLMEEIASEDGTLDLLYAQDSLVGVQSFWGIEEREQRLLICEAPYMREKAEPKPAIMARIITPAQFVRAVHLKAQVQAEEMTLRLYLEDPFLQENEGLWLWHLNRESSWMERETAREGSATCLAGPKADDTSGFEDRDSRTAADLHLTITELTAWLFGYEVPEAAGPYEDVIETLNGVFLDEVV